MDPAKRSDLLDFLTKNNLLPKRSLSQNFLIDKNIVVKLIQEAQVKPGEFVYEIGPGPGALTRGLLDAGANVIAIEKDHAFAKYLPRLIEENQSLQVFEQDVLLFPFDVAPNKAKVISNIPYHLTSPILEQLAYHKKSFSVILLMVQLEIAERLLAKQGDRNNSALSIFSHYHFKPSIVHTISPSCFYPPPKVKSAIIKLEPRFDRTCQDPENFFRFVKYVFHKRRKMLRKILPEITFEKISPTKRPEELGVEDFLFLFESLDSSSLHKKP